MLFVTITLIDTFIPKTKQLPFIRRMFGKKSECSLDSTDYLWGKIFIAF